MNLQQLKHFFLSSLSSIYDEQEIINILWLWLEETTQIQKKKLLTFSILPVTILQINEAIEQLQTGKPIQYLLSKSYFYGITFSVNEHVLIPRQETEELVHWIIEDNKSKSQIHAIDFCTGSGCIAIALKKNVPSMSIDAIDISENAIQIAKKNAVSNDVDVNFFKSNIFNFSSNKVFDIIVSNPPYVMNREKKNMHKNVLLFEPPLALFVEDENPLIFYEKIVELAVSNLTLNGTLYFEINESSQTEMFRLLENNQFNKVQMKTDLNGKNRMIKASKQ